MILTDADFERIIKSSDPRPITVRFTVPGQPVAKGRPIAGKGFGGHTTLRTPAKTLAYEGLVASMAHNAMAGRPPLEGPLGLTLQVGVQIPKSFGKTKARLAELGEVGPTKKPDLDNIIKGICDGMNGVAYVDDSQIIEMNVRKVYTQTPGVQVILRALAIDPA